MQPNQKTTLLWLSDIHIWEKYKEFDLFRNELPHYLQAFYEVLPDRIDYLLLGSDIGFAGNSEDYRYFWELFSHVLKQPKFSATRVLVVPGNHDICWTTSEDLIKTVKSTSQESYLHRTHQYLTTTKKTEYLRTFQSFTQFFNGPEWSRFFADQELNDTYREHKLFGYSIDRPRKLLFILLNTSWVSLGNQFNTLLLTAFRQKESAIRGDSGTLPLAEVIDAMSTLLQNKDSIAEYGSQVTGKMLLQELDLLRKVLYENPDFTVLTLMHHPLNWLHWSEKYSYKEEVQATLPLQNILRLTNFLLTGHEHVPSVKSHEVFDKDTYHLKAGCFLDEVRDSSDFFSLEHNRFNILEIYTGRSQNWLLEKGYSYRPIEHKGMLQHTWISSISPAPLFYQPKHADHQPKESSAPFNLSAYLSYLNPTDAPLQFSFDDSTDYFLYDAGSKTYIVSKTSEAPSQLLECHFVRTILARKQKNERGNKVSLHFVFKDVHLAPSLYSPLSEGSAEEVRNRREEMFEGFYAESKITFDVFRNLFFCGLEEDDSISAEAILHTNLIFNVLPFWIFQSFQVLVRH